MSFGFLRSLPHRSVEGQLWCKRDGSFFYGRGARVFWGDLLLAFPSNVRTVFQRIGQAFSCAQPFFGVLRVCVCSTEGLLQGRKWQNPRCCDGALFGQRFFLSVCSRQISIGRARLVFAAGLEAGPGRPVCLCACLVLETVFGIECVRVCVCVFHARFA